MFHQHKPLVGLPADDLVGDVAGVLSLLGSGSGDLRLLASLPLAIYIVDSVGRLVFFNESAANMWGSSPVLGQSVFDQWREIDGSGAVLDPHQRPIASVLRRLHPVRGAEGSALRLDGSIVHFSASPTPLLDTDGRLAAVIDVLVDVTAHRATEARLRESEAHYVYAVELNPQMPWTADADGAILHVSDRWCRLTGQSVENALRDGWTAAAIPEDMPGVLAAVTRCGRTGDPLDVRFRALLADRDVRWMRARARARRDDQGRVVRWYGSTEDIHDAVMAEQALAAAEERYRYAALATKDVFWDHDLRTDRVLWSDCLEETFGHVPDEDASAGTFWLGNVHSADRDRVERSLADAVAAGASRWTAEYRFRRADGTYAHVLDCGTLLRGEDGTVVRAIGAMLDFSDRKQTEAELRLSEERLRLALSAARLGIADFDVRTGEEHWSDELRQILGVPADAPSGVRTYLSLVHPDDLAGAAEQHRRTRAADFGHGFRATRRIVRPLDGEIRWISTEGHVVRNEAGKAHRVIITVRDVTDDKLAQDRITWAATHDAMTDLPNKAAFQQALSQATEAPLDRLVSLLLVDLDNFKHVNDTLGHQAGDVLLVEVGRRLREALPTGAMVARFGGDEFAIILDGESNAGAEETGRRLLQVLERPCGIDGARSVDVRASIGVATYPADGRDASTLLQAADIALYGAKATGRYAVRRYAPEMRAGLQLKVSTIRQARDALTSHAILPYYQPKVSLLDGRTVGTEALLRWHHPRHGIQEAGSLLAALDDPELGERIGKVMWDAVLADVRSWLDLGAPVGRVAVNMSPVQFGRAGLAERLLRSLDGFGIPTALLEIEITETTLIGARAEQVVHELAALREAGVTIALDDFGTGYSSLSHLARFPVDVIKIDRSFVAGLTRTRADAAVVEAVLGLSTALGLVTVAEGLETEEQATRLRELGCPLAQGFLYSAALPPGQFDWRSRY